MSKIVFLDVDGTLIDYNAHLPESAAQAVGMARANGHKVYICTGCSKAEIEQRNPIAWVCFWGKLIHVIS